MLDQSLGSVVTQNRHVLDRYTSLDFHHGGLKQSYRSLRSVTTTIIHSSTAMTNQRKRSTNYLARILRVTDI